MNKLGVYIHIPFCNGKCKYCDFVSGVYSDEVKRDYFDALKREIRDFDFSDYIIDSIYFGGGTPSSVPEKYIAEILDALSAEKFVSNPELSIECNPESLSESKCAAFSAAGINRLSMGLQSATDSLLERIGRLHTVSDFLRALDFAEKYFDNISADIMLGLPEQSPHDVKRAVNLLAGRNLKHISAYALKVEEGTPLAQSGFVPDEDYSADLYDLVCEMLADYGYSRYEVSNFAFPNFECRHNLRYWERGEYKGFGVAAHSFIRNYRIENTPDIGEYIGGRREINSYYIEPHSKEAANETVMLSLRTAVGFDLDKYQKTFGSDLIKEKGEIVRQLSDYLEIKNGRLKLTDMGFYVMNDIILKLTD